MPKKMRNNYEKETLRGTIKEIMKRKGLRAISVKNYDDWANNDGDRWLHSIKLDIENGFLYLHGFNERDKFRSGGRIPDETADMYAYAYSKVREILEKEDEIPSKAKRNILVRVSR